MVLEYNFMVPFMHKKVGPMQNKMVQTIKLNLETFYLYISKIVLLEPKFCTPNFGTYYLHILGTLNVRI